MASFVKFNDFAEQIGLKKINLDTDVLKVFLTNSTPNVTTNTVFTDLTDLTTTGGYTAGGADATGVWSETPAGTGSLTCTDIVWTGSGSGFGPFRYAVLYSDTSAAKNLISYWDYGSSISVLSGETFTVDFGATTLTIT
jgi:hypothetical protein